MAEPKLLYIIEAVDDPDDLPLENVNVNSTAAERPRGQSPEDLLDGGEVGEQGEPGILLGPVATNEVASHASYETNREVTLSRGSLLIPEMKALFMHSDISGGRREPGVELLFKASIIRDNAVIPAIHSETNCQDGGEKYFCVGDPTRTKYEEATIYLQEGKDNDLFKAHPQGRWSKLAYNILHHPAFYISDLVVSVLLMMLAILERPSVIKLDDSRPLMIATSTLEILFLSLLVVDILLRLIWFGPKNFIRHARTIFTTVVLVVMFGEVISVVIRQRNHFRVTRALRPLFFIDSLLMDGMRGVLRKLFNSLVPIVNMLFLLFFSTILSALIGYYLFATVSFTFFSSLYQAFVSLSITLTTSNNPDIMLESFSRYSAAPIFFITYLIVSVYFIANILLAVVIAEFDDQDKKKFKKLFLHEREALHKAYSVLAGTNLLSFEEFLKFMKFYKPQTPEWHILCIFKAMQASPDRKPRNWFLKVEEFCNLYEVLNYKWTKGGEKLWYEKFLPTNVQQPFFYISRMVSSPWFYSISVIIVMLYNSFLTIYTLTIPASSANSRFEELRKVIPVSFIFILFYCGEIGLTIVGKGPKDYFKSFWNVLDCTLVVFSLFFLCFEINPTYAFFLAVRPLVFMRVLILKRRYHNILNTLSLISARLLSIGLLLIVIFYFFAIIGMEAFGDDRYETVFKGCCSDAWYQVGSFYEGPMLVPFNGTASENVSNNVFPNSSFTNIGTTNVYYLINFDHIFNSYVTLFTLMVVNNWFIIMEGFASAVQISWLARLYFFSFYVVTLVVIQVVITYIVEAFVLRIKYFNKKVHCHVHNKIHRCHGTEKDNHSKRVRVELVKEDIQKLKYVLVNEGQMAPRRWSVKNIIYYFRHSDLSALMDTTTIVSGQRRQTKEDIHLLQYQHKLPIWIRNYDEMIKKGKNRVKPTTALRTRFLKIIIKWIEYIVE